MHAHSKQAKRRAKELAKQQARADALVARLRREAAQRRAREDEIVEQARAIFRSRGGQRRAARLTPAQRSAIARLGGLAKAKGAHYNTRGQITNAGMAARLKGLLDAGGTPRMQ
jgi:hypothetical protein